MLAVVSDQYASRPWCRRELRTFCRPERVLEGPVEVWAQHPVLVVDVLEGKLLTRGLAELATVPVVRWQQDLPAMQQEEMVVTLLLREIFFDGHARLVARHLALKSADESRIILSWKPDAMTLQYVMAGRTDLPATVLYPGREISAGDEHSLRELFPNTTFLSFAEVNMESEL